MRLMIRSKGIKSANALRRRFVQFDRPFHRTNKGASFERTSRNHRHDGIRAGGDDRGAFYGFLGGRDGNNFDTQPFAEMLSISVAMFLGWTENLNAFDLAHFSERECVGPRHAA